MSLAIGSSRPILAPKVTLYIQNVPSTDNIQHSFLTPFSPASYHKHCLAQSGLRFNPPNCRTMPLISFSKPRSKKSPTAISSLSSNQTIPAGPSTTTSSFHVNPSSTASLSISPKGSRSLGRTKDRFSKAFTFSLESFNVAGSIRGRSKPIQDINNNFSSHSISHSHTTYTGYEDEEYGEPDVEAEEIRPPSGLGRTATTLEFNDDSIDIERSDPIFTSLSRPSIKVGTNVLGYYFTKS